MTISLFYDWKILMMSYSFFSLHISFFFYTISKVIALETIYLMNVAFFSKWRFPPLRKRCICFCVLFFPFVNVILEPLTCFIKCATSTPFAHTFTSLICSNKNGLQVLPIRSLLSRGLCCLFFTRWTDRCRR